MKKSLIFVAILFWANIQAQPSVDLRIQPQPAVTSTLQLFEDYPIVAFGEMHSLQELGDFFIELVKHPDFAENVGNVVLEFGNSFFQETVDRYIAGEDVPYEKVKKAWTTLIATGGPTEVSVMYGQFYEAVREVNQTLPDDKKIKIWLGDPPANPDDPKVYLAENFPDRDAFYARVIMEEILEKDRKALVIIGAGHFVDDEYSRSSATVEELESKSFGAYYNFIAYINAYYPDEAYTIQVHWGLPNQDCNQRLESAFSSQSLPVLVSLEATSLAEFLNGGECKVNGWWGTLAGAWAKGFLYLGAVDDLTLSPLPGEAEQSFSEVLKEMFSENE